MARQTPEQLRREADRREALDLLVRAVGALRSKDREACMELLDKADAILAGEKPA